MSQTHTAVFGLYDDRRQAEGAISALISAGFPAADLSVLVSAGVGEHDLAHERHTKAPEAAAAGVATGGALGGAFGLLAGLGTLAVPALGPMLAAGPLMSALAGMGAGGAVGGLIGALVGFGIPEYVAVRYAGHVEAGRVLLSVHCDSSDLVTEAKQVLEATGGKDVDAAPESESGTTSPDADLPSDHLSR